jgi:hypothetical protein
MMIALPPRRLLPRNGASFPEPFAAYELNPPLYLDILDINDHFTSPPYAFPEIRTASIGK